MRRFEVEIEGVPPGLLMHKFAIAEDPKTQDLKTTTKAIPKPEIEAEEGAYRLETGELYQPAEHIYQAMCKAAGEFQIKGRGKKTYRDSIRGNLLVEPECILHGQKHYSIDARPARIQRARIMRHRPLLPQWKLTFELTLLDESAIPVQVLNAVIVKAGQSIGIGDYRPRFGRFIVTKFEELKD